MRSLLEFIQVTPKVENEKIDVVLISEDYNNEYLIKFRIVTPTSYFKIKSEKIPNVGTKMRRIIETDKYTVKIVSDIGYICNAHAEFNYLDFTIELFFDYFEQE